MRLLAPIAFAAAALFAGAVIAEDTPPDTRAACRASALELCRAEAFSGDRLAVRACMIKNFDKTSPECQAAMKAKARYDAQQAKTPDKPSKP